MVITGSSYSRTDLMERYGLSADRVAVTPYAADTRYRPQESSVVSATLGRLGLPTEYILYVGNLQPRKNIVRLLDAYVRLQGSRPPLVIAGQRAWLHTDIFATVRRHRLTDAVHFTGYLADGDLPAVYGGAMLFAYPSLFEGFGLPVLEAMACGTPTLASRTSSIPEVAGDGALLIDPLNTDEMVDGLQRLIQSNALRASLRARGLLQATRFSWDRCAEETVAVYQRALAR
jgi:glycosyltransferase involved in cell wall biosynthesis